MRPRISGQRPGRDRTAQTTGKQSIQITGPPERDPHSDPAGPSTETEREGPKADSQGPGSMAGISTGTMTDRTSAATGPVTVDAVRTEPASPDSGVGTDLPSAAVTNPDSAGTNRDFTAVTGPDSVEESPDSAATSRDSAERAADLSSGETVRTVSLRSAAASSTVSAPNTPAWRNPVCPRHPQW